MKRLVTWVKGNLFVVGSIVLAVVALGVLGYDFFDRQIFLQRLDQRDDEVFKPIKMLRSTPIEYPPATPGAPAIVHKGFVTLGVIKERRDDINQAFTEQNTTVFEKVSAINHARRQISDMSNADKFPLPQRAMTDFRTKVIGMFGPPGPGAADEPRLGAGMPPAANDPSVLYELNNEALRFDRTHRSMNAIQAQRDQEARARLLNDRVLQILQNKAKSIHIYAVPRPNWTAPGAAVAPGVTFGPDRQEFPVDLTAMDPTRFTGPPPLGEVWEAQMQMLVIQDILWAIARANQTDNPQSNVLNAPVKQILKIKVFPGYVTGKIAASGSGGGRLETVPGENRGGGGRLETVPTPGGGGNPTAPGPGGAAAVAGIVDSDEQPGLTGRKSNPLYDVKHAALSVVVDYQQLPKLFQELAAVNFMTVLKMQISNVDEYEALKKGFVYGPQDCVKVDMLIESVWFRNWIVKSMPEEIRTPLGATVAAP